MAFQAGLTAIVRLPERAPLVSGLRITGIWGLWELAELRGIRLRVGFQLLAGLAHLSIPLADSHYTADPHRLHGAHFESRLCHRNVDDLVGRRGRRMDTGAEVGDKQKLADFVACPFQRDYEPGNAYLLAIQAALHMCVKAPNARNL